MRKIIGISAIALLLGAPVAMAQTSAPGGSSSENGERAGSSTTHGGGVTAVESLGTAPATGGAARDSNIATPRNDPDTTNRARGHPVGPYHDQMNGRGGVTGPVAPHANGG